MLFEFFQFFLYLIVILATIASIGLLVNGIIEITERNLWGVIFRSINRYVVKEFFLGKYTFPFPKQNQIDETKNQTPA